MVETKQSLSLAPLLRPLTSLIGREEACQTIRTRLQTPEVRLLTLTGTGGVGKTRLALELAHELQDTFADGVCFLSLVSTHDPALVLPMVAQAFGQEVRAQSPFAVVRACLSKKQLLLILDNVEHLLAAAPPLVALLTACPGLKLLVTSRERLGIEGEWIWVVPPLPIPSFHQVSGSLDLIELTQVPSVRLFLARAREHHPSFSLHEANARTVAEICMRLDGLPLALELAAARINLLPPEELLARLSSRLSLLTGGDHDLPERHRTLRHTIQWSYSLLSYAEQRLFRSLSLFAGGCLLSTLERLYTLLDEHGEPVIDLVASLLDKHLLQARTMKEIPGETRLVLFETFREFASEQLAASGEGATQERAYALCYADLAAQVRPKLDGSDQSTWFAFLEAELENIRAVLRWSLSHDVEVGLRVATTLNIFWRVRGHIQEINQYFRLALSQKREIPVDLRAGSLDWAGTFALLDGDYQRAEMLNTQSYELYGALNNAGGMADSLFVLARIAGEFHLDYPKAQQLFEQCLQLYQKQGDLLGYTETLNELAWIAQVMGEYPEACRLAQESIALCRKLDDAFDLLLALRRMVGIDLEQGRYREAQASSREAFEHAQKIQDKSLMSAFLLFQGQIMVMEQGLAVDGTQARALLEEGLALAREVGAQEYVASALLALGRLALIQNEYSLASDSLEACCHLAKEAFEWDTWHQAQCQLTHVELRQGLVRDASQRLENIQAPGKVPMTKQGEILYLETLAHLATVHGESRLAARLWGAANAMRTLFALPRSSFERHVFYDQALARTRLQLSEQDFAVAWGEGEHPPPSELEQVLNAWDTSVLLQQKPIQKRGKAPDDPEKTEARSLSLTRRELEVLRLVSEGLTNRQIAERLVISVVTVNSYLRSVFHKLEVSSRTAALRYALKYHLL